MTAGQQLTDEQRAVVEHPAGAHARVLAIAGSGKTTTLVSRVAHLIQERRVPPERIVVLMFNALARKQFREKAARVGLPAAAIQRVHTFHSYAYGTLQRAGGLPAGSDIWIEDKAELQRRCVHAAIAEFGKAGLVAPGEIDPEEALGAIGMWKGALVPPGRAGYRGHPLIPQVYAAFERLRMERKGITFDDFVPMAVEVLQARATDPDARPRYAHVIVDEYQDVNLGQQVLVETLAGREAEVMVVGDDDQTIYEWRGARPDYIRELFPKRFPDRETRTYTLTYSFRFGPLIAQCADNVIQRNRDRHPKPVVARQVSKQSHVAILASTSEQPSEVERMLCAEITRLRDEYRARGITDLRERVVVLGRTFSQMAGLEGECIRRGIPYCVVGKAPFLERHEVVTLLEYVRVAHRFDEPMDERLGLALQRIVNMPNRRIPTSDIRRAITRGRELGWSPRRALQALTDDQVSALPRDLRERVSDLAIRLERLGELAGRDDRIADEVLEWLVNAVDYLDQFRSYYGDGEDSFERLATVEAFRQFARQAGKPILSFMKMVDGIDPTRGVPREEQVVFTTVHRTKGLEFDHVVIPSCVEGMMPVNGGSESLTYDTANVEAEPVSSSVLENERRLFYVAITRAREQVLIGTAGEPLQGAMAGSNPPLPSRFLEEVRLAGGEAIGGGIARCRDQETVGLYIRGAMAAYQRDRSLDGAIRNAAERYLPDIGYVRAAERLRRLLTESPPVSFGYARQYQLIEQKRVSRAVPAESAIPLQGIAIAPEKPDADYD